MASSARHALLALAGSHAAEGLPRERKRTGPPRPCGRPRTRGRVGVADDVREEGEAYGASDSLSAEIGPAAGSQLLGYGDSRVDGSDAGLGVDLPEPSTTLNALYQIRESGPSRMNSERDFEVSGGVGWSSGFDLVGGVVIGASSGRYSPSPSRARPFSWRGRRSSSCRPTVRRRRLRAFRLINPVPPVHSGYASQRPRPVA